MKFVKYQRFWWQYDEDTPLNNATIFNNWKYIKLDNNKEDFNSNNKWKYFAKNIILMPANELSDDKILHFIEIIL